MHLVSTEPQTVRLDHTVVEFKRGESIHTENSYKYEQAQFRDLAAKAGWRFVRNWSDDGGLFSVEYFEAE